MNTMILRKVRTLFPLAGLLMLAVTAAHAEIMLKTELNDGDKISDVAKLTAKAESTDGIDKVEFRVDDELRHTDTSTPYVYEWDTIKDKEGMHAVTVTAYDSNGSTKRVALSLTIDNEIGLGAEALAGKAQDALKERNYAEAARYSRRALKAEPGNINAARAQAGVYGAQREWSKAIAALKDANGLDTNAPAMRELAGYRIQNALLPDNAANFYGELVSADELRRKAADLALKETVKQNTPADGKRTAQQHEAIGDMLLEAGKFREAVVELSKSGIGDDAPLASMNRLGLAYVLDEHPQEALSLLRPTVRAKKADAQTRAVMGLAQLRLRLFADALATVQPDIASQNPASLIVAAYANAALGKKREANALAKDATGLLPNSGDAQFALAIAATDPKDSEAAVHRALALTPFQTGPYLDYAARVAISRRQDRVEQALNLTDFVLKYEPENFNAKEMQALLYLSEKRFADAEPILTWLRRKDAKAPDVIMTLATYFELKNEGPTVSQLLAAAKEADKRFERQGPETPLEFLTTLNRRYFYRTGFFLRPSTLYPQG
jgi:tetratricopeptide (TPR) repeat protein